MPAGARISAGKSGKVLTSFPNTADVLVNWSPVNCIPSPESPEKRMTTELRSSVVCPCSKASETAAFSAIDILSSYKR